eukprot:TRINITY_DN6074_c0_g1_i2.p1 TRINITY_DN6074_c0_g1~~TRINITY_DN6074_c0_g1_i2.p1  ORF type:complete len:113 (+),score=13.29 TRINITY_DN6074_c0_g1_i2:45-383(+)
MSTERVDQEDPRKKARAFEKDVTIYFDFGKDEYYDMQKVLRQPMIDANENLRLMKENPEDFFNFGFSYDDYRQFMAKQILMRLERYIIKTELEAATQPREPVGYPPHNPPPY